MDGYQSWLYQFCDGSRTVGISTFTLKVMKATEGQIPTPHVVQSSSTSAS